MEDVLDVYQREYDENCPVICMDEKPYQLLDESRKPIPMRHGEVKRYDRDYVRNGTCSIFIFTEPLKAWRSVSVSERRTKKDWAEHVEELLEVHYPNVPKVCMVMDNLNTHVISSLYEAFSPEKPAHWQSDLKFITHQSMESGSTWLKLS